jgi:hypothetical protein
LRAVSRLMVIGSIDGAVLASDMARAPFGTLGGT